MKFNKSAPVGVTDSGVGGLTVAAEIMKLLPGEDIIYYGDTKNVPYGNRSAEEIFALSAADIRYLADKGVKAVVIACNTISSMADSLREKFPEIPIISIVEAGAKEVCRRGLDDVTVASTVFTARSGGYKKEIARLNPGCAVTAVGLPNLAKIVEDGANQEEVKKEIGENLDKILLGKKGNLVLGCTHFPIVADYFKKLYPDVNLIDPAASQARLLKELLEQNDLINPGGGSISLNFSGPVGDAQKLLDSIRNN